jgi:indole-3-glycerol phosphate synthase / phosphoribosylanthranilate isomerase
MKGFLAEVYAQKIRELAAAPFIETLKTGSAGAAACNAPDFRAALAGPGIHLIAEVKPASPSAGVLQQENIETTALLSAYNKYASAVSVLTDSRYFKGSFDLLKEVVGLTRLPVLCKDFIIDAKQIAMARHCGASAVLLIVKMLDCLELGRLAGQIEECGMAPVFEVHCPEELKLAEYCGARIILINNRNLETLELDMQTTARLAPLAPRRALTISGSGIESAAALRSLRPFVSRFLIGSALMKSLNPDKTLCSLKESGLQEPAGAVP